MPQLKKMTQEDLMTLYYCYLDNDIPLLFVVKVACYLKQKVMIQNSVNKTSK